MSDAEVNPLPNLPHTVPVWGRVIHSKSRVFKGDTLKTLLFDYEANA
jgi:hypothetical protein